MRRRRHRRTQTDVELNLAAMLDMAFQLLAFFILTFNPGAVEGQIAMRMPPPLPISSGKASAHEAAPDERIDVPPVETLVITAMSDDEGALKSVRLAQGEPMANLKEVEDRLQDIFSVPELPFEQVVLQVDSRLRYQYVMQLLDTCVRIKLHTGEPLRRLSFVELPEGETSEVPTNDSA